MQTQKTGLDFKGQNIFVGIDVHLKSWAVTILTDNLVHKTFTQPASADTLSNYLKGNFPGGDYYSVYEAGFSGFWTHYKLKEMGINNIVINPADVLTTQKEHLQKDDPTDSRKKLFKISLRENIWVENVVFGLFILSRTGQKAFQIIIFYPHLVPNRTIEQILNSLSIFIIFYSEKIRIAYKFLKLHL